MHDEVLTLPHPYAHVRAFVLVPWLAVEPDAAVTVEGQMRTVAQLLGDIDPAERSGVRLTESVLRARNES